MNTTNVLSYIIQEATMSKADNKNLVELSNTASGTDTFQEILNQIGTSATSSESNDSTYSYADKSTEQNYSVTEDNYYANHTERYKSALADKVKSKEADTTLPVSFAGRQMMKEFSEEMTTLLCATLNITPNELNAKLNELGLQLEELVEPSNLAMLFTECGEGLTLADALVSEDFQSLIVQIDELSEEFSLRLDITREELRDLIDEIGLFPGEDGPTPITLGDNNTASPMAQQDVTTGDTQMMQTNADELPVVEAVQKNDASQQLVGETPEEVDGVTMENIQVTSETDEQQMNLAQNNGESENVSDSDNVVNDEMFSKMEADEFEVKDSNIDKDDFRVGLGEQSIKQTTYVDADDATVRETVKIVDVQSLVSEFTEYVRLTSGNEFSRIEMQLNPANLGKMIVEVTSANGEITAKIITQTETGKEAVESNLAQMKTNLEQQGVKVAAVEVTIESHAFEQNLQGEQSNEQQQLMKEQQEATRRQQLNLNLNDMTLDELYAVMSEEELLTVKMMQESGNTMDLTV